MRRQENFWAEKPFAKLSIPFTIGLLASIKTDLNALIWFFAIFCFLFFVALYECLPLHQKWRFRNWIGCFIHFVFFAWGGWVYSYTSNLKQKPSIYSHALFIFKIEDAADHTKTIQRIQVRVFQIDSNRAIEKGKGLLTLTVPQNLQMQRNDIVLSNIGPKEIKLNLNPGEPDFQKIQNRQGIYWTIYWDSLHMTTIKKGVEDKETQRLKIKQSIVNTLRQYITDQDRSRLASALLIGHREELNQEWVDAYMHTGVIHVIAISGMHLGLIFSLITGLAYSFVNKMRARQFSVVFVLPAIWLFAILTGGPASIVRSAWMFTVFILAQILFRKNNNINSLALSAYVMLNLSADSINDLGFQLSFAAVGSLLLYQKQFSAMLYVRNKVLKQIWQIIATTLAAQVLTIPLVIYHFKSFPLLFVISNVIVVPLSSVILVLLILIVILSPFPYLAESLGRIIDLLIEGMNSYVIALDQIPGIQFPLYTWKSTTCLILGIALSALLKKSKSSNLIFYSPWIWGVLLTWDIYWQELKLKDVQKLYILQKANSSILIHQHGKYGELILEKNNISAHAMEKLKENTGKELGITHWKERLLTPSTQILHLDSVQPGCRLNQSLDVIRRGTNLNLNEIQAWLPSRLWVADGSNKVWKIKEWQSHAQKLDLHLYSTPEKGFIGLDCHPFPRR